ncbi:MAG: DNA recombination protein RmuC, partial [Bacteroidales bacterium]|nr:DNA recombination protein RmuC [Bacteroidales bacterium]
FFIIGLIIGALLVGFVLKSKNSSLQTQIDFMKEQELKNEELRNKQFETQINALKSELQNTTEKLLRQREESLVRANSVQLDAVLNPLKNEIEGMKKSMVDNIKTNSENKASIEKAIEDLMKRTQDIGNDANNLAKALKNESKTQGNWGELILENILEKSGLTEGEHYEKQTTLKDARGNMIFHDETGSKLIPDVVVHYPDNKDLVIDSKVSLTAFVDYCNASDDTEKAMALKRHLQSMKSHCKELQKKNYSSYIKSPRVSLNYVVMFVPNESAMQLALYEDNTLWREAFENGVFITSEQNLLALLRMIQLAWSQVKQARNQQEIFDEVNKLLDRVGEFMKRYDDLGKKIESLQGSYDDTKKKLYSGNQSVVKAAEKLIDMGGKSDKLIRN